MANNLSNTKSLTSKSGTDGGADFVVQNITLIYPNETLVKKEASSIVVRNVAGKLVRRTSPEGFLPEIYNLIQDGEVFVREEESRLIVRTKAGSLVARPIIIEEVLEEEFEDVVADELPDDDDLEEVEELQEDEDLELPDLDELEEEQKEEPVQEVSSVSDSLRERLKSRHSFLDRIDKGEKVGVAPTVKQDTNFKPVNTDLVEEIDDEEILPDAEVLALESAVEADSYNRSQGRVSGKGRRVGDRGTHVAGGAINPNEKPSLAGSEVSKGLVGNYALATPEKEIVIPVLEKKKPKKERKPVQPWVVVVALVSIYVLGMLAYFFIGYNFDNKSVGVVLYYIDIGENAKLEYYDGEQFNYNEMKMTFYYSDDRIESFNITGENFANTTIGMGYTINNNEFINARWEDSFKNSELRVVKVKFAFENLICYVPVTIHRNRLLRVETCFELENIEAGQELSPTIFGVYTNKILEQRSEEILKIISIEDYDLFLNINGVGSFNLRELGFCDGEKYTLPPSEFDHDADPETDDIIIDYSGFGSSVNLVVQVKDNLTTKTVEISKYNN